MYGHEPTMPLQMLDMVEINTEVPVKESAENVFKAEQATLIIWDHIHDKAAENIKCIQE